MSQCFFCDSEITSYRLGGNMIFAIECPLCGYYRMTEEAILFRKPNLPKEDLILFSGYLRNNSSERNVILLYSKDIMEINKIIAPYKRLTVIDKINLILRYVGDSLKFLGDRIQLKDTDYTKFYCLNSDEIVHIYGYLVDNGFLAEDPYPLCRLTVRGWQAYQELGRINIESKKVFVAMNFDPEFKYVFDEAIFPACDVCGFIAFRVDSEEHTQKICDKVIADIKESRFLIADFTGQKHGVYFEAGFARGLGLEVIWTCKEEDKDNLHFDTRQYSHILWKDQDDFKNQLINKIKAVIK